MLKEGDAAPAFTTKDQDGMEHSLEDYRGRWLVLYFYPKDETSGCTTEACNFRDAYEHLRDLADIVGVSADTVESHNGFREHHKLPFALLADPEHSVINAYGVATDVAKRATFIIDSEGFIRMIYPKVDPETHAAEIEKDLKRLQS